MAKPNKKAIGVGAAALLAFLLWPKSESKAKKLEEEPKKDYKPYDKPSPKKNEWVTPEIKSTPTPGFFYAIKAGDNLLKITGKAYGLKAGTTARLNKSQEVNSVEYNKRFHVDSMSKFNEKYYPEGIISFFPKYSEDIKDQILNTFDGGRGLGKAYPIIWFPSPENPEPPEEFINI